MTLPAEIPQIQVLAAPQIDPAIGRVEITVAAGATLAEIVDQALPTLAPAQRSLARVILVRETGQAPVRQALWSHVRPKPGVRVVIRLVPGRNALRSVLSIVISVAAVALGGIWGPMIGSMLGVGATVGTALVTLGVTVIGNLLVNALIPPPSTDDERRNSYSISGFRNQLRPDGAVPVILGTMRYAPPFAATSWTEIVGDDQYVRALFCLGEGELEITDLRIGDTSLEEYDEVETELRYGTAGEAPVSLYPRQVVEQQIGVELTRPLPRNDAGDVIQGPTKLTPVVRTTGPDAEGASLILAWPGGLVRFDDRGQRRRHEVRVRIEQRRIDATNWQLVEELAISAQKTEGFYRQHSWKFPARDRYQVRLTMLTDESEDNKRQQRTTWAALQTLRPEYPINYPRPLSLIALRIKATHQLNGALDDVTAVASRVCLDWDQASGTWIRRRTSNPASLYRYALQSAANPRRVADATLDLDLLQDWHAFCQARGLTYNRVLDDASATLRDVLTEIAAAGRATPRHDGLRWGVVIDRPSRDALIVDHINPRNSWDFKWRRPYIEPPHAFVVPFNDAANDYKQTQREIRWPGYQGEITLTEELQLPGKVHADEVWREARRRQLEAIHRPDVYQATQDGSVRVATRGDAIATSHYVLSNVQRAARVTDVSGMAVVLDELVTIEAGQDYALRWRQFRDEADTIGVSQVAPVTAAIGETSLLTVTGIRDLPEVGALVHFGPVATESAMQIVTNIEVTEDQASIVRTVDAAPQIDEILAKTSVPPWSSRIGREIDVSALKPGAPRFKRVTSGVRGALQVGRISYLLDPASGPVGTARFEVRHRRAGTSNWSVITVPAASGGGAIDGYRNGDTVQISARGLSAAGARGPYTSIITLTVGSNDPAIPAALEPVAVTITALLGGLKVTVATGNDAATTALQIYRSRVSNLSRENDAAGAPVSAPSQQTITVDLGDATRQNLTAPDAWSGGSGWTVQPGGGGHTPGTSSALTQSLSTDNGAWYRISYRVSGRTAGSVTPRLTGGSDRPGSQVAADGQHSDRIQAVTGNNQIALIASADFDGRISEIILYRETGACLAQGAHYVWVEPQGADGIPGPVSGPHLITVR